MNYEDLQTPQCPKFDCREKCCKGFAYYSIPASLGDDSEGSEAAPKNGAFCDALVKYENGGAIYLYSKEGIPTMLTNGTESGIFIPHLEVDEATATAILSWTNNIGRENPEPINIKGEKGEPGKDGEKGEKGDPGTAIAIKGEVPTEADLPTDAKEGDAWMVQGNLYVWTGADWQNVGRVQGPQGEIGPYYEPHLADDPDNDEVILSWTNTGGLPNPNPVNIKGHEGSNANAKVLHSNVPLVAFIGATTTLNITNLDEADQGDISAPETEIYDSYGTVGVVTSFSYETNIMVVKTITISPVERQGVRLGTVNTPADLPNSVAVATAMGWTDVITGDFAYVREDPSHDDFMAEYYISDILGDETIVWAYSHSINNGDYQVASDPSWDGYLLTGGNLEGTWGAPLPVDVFQFASNGSTGDLLVQGSDPNTFGPSLPKETFQLANDDTMTDKILVGGADNTFGTPIDIDTYQIANDPTMTGKLLVGGTGNNFGTPIEADAYQVANTAAMVGKLLVGGSGNNYGTPIDPDDLETVEITTSEIDTYWSDQAWGTSM